MDRRFLSDEQIIKASRDFVCIRTATYEDKTEATYLKAMFLGRAGGDLRNFGFCILSPDGKRQLRRSNRGPNFVYTNSQAMAADLRQIAKQYSAQARDKKVNPAVPRMKSVRLGINVASCDGLPSVVVFGKGKREVDRLNSKLSGVIWDAALAGKFIYSSTTKSSDLKIIVGATRKAGILVVEPDVYGMTGRLIKMIDASVSKGDLKRDLVDAADTFTRRSKTHGLHVRNGRRNGKTWKTEVPVPNRVRARGRPTPRRRRRE
ncbi:MAG: hypothetical protein CMJ59_02235 [Planctomycetaceae bacterium]|nr:hypothetical protein [Planctomycetaceae bacterium]